MPPHALSLLLAAAPPAGSEGGGLLSMLLPFLLVFVVFYFFIIRPQKMREDTRKSMIEAVQKGDRVVTIGGIHAHVVKVEDAQLLVQIDDNTKVRLDKNAVASVAKKD
jgi:preprotein translocase subunit YajC